MGGVNRLSVVIVFSHISKCARLALVITLIPSLVTAQNPDNSGLSAPPLIWVTQENQSIAIDYENPHPVIYSASGNATLLLTVRLPYSVYDVKTLDDIMWTGNGYLTSVSYVASWKNNQTINLYTNSSTNNIQNVDSKGQLLYSLTNIPYGNQQIEINASCTVFLFANGFSSTYPFYQTSTHSINFTVATTLTPIPVPTANATNLEQTAIITVIAVSLALFATVILLLYIRHRKAANSKQ